MDINKIILVGRLTRDAELRYTNSGTANSKLSLAVNRRVKNGDTWGEEVSFFDVNIWGKTAESLNQYLLKGKQIGVEGELRQNRWEQDGQSRSRVEVNANNIQLLGSNTGSSQQRASQQNNENTNAQSFETFNQKVNTNNDRYEDDIPF